MVARQLHSQFARRDNGRRKLPQTRADRRREIAALQGFVDTADDARRLQHILRPAGESDRLLMVQHIGETRIDQHQIGKSHVFQRPCCGADIAAAAGFDQHESQAPEKRFIDGLGDLRQVHLK